ncbi:DMT family transporter [Streptomyces sp. NPDC089799]|uniref:DMT family transporter n=1 Tax=Streptomyces sp. NPDC089799 TaxID=3155066 RepID=UPI0034132CC3
MNATALAIGLSLGSSLAYASAAVAQERLARTSAAGTARALLGNGAWWWSASLNAGAALLHAAALRYGPLTLVQPLGALTLVAAMPLGARRAGRRVTRTEWRGTLATVAGLALLLLPASGPAPEDTLSLAEALAVSGATTGVILALTAARASRSGLRHATASGLASAVASALTQTVAVATAAGRDGSLPSLRVAGVALLVLVFAGAGLLLSQRAYRGGLGAPLAVVNLANPLAAAAIGVVLLGERLQGGAAGLLLCVAGAATAARGVLLLTRPVASPVPAAPADRAYGGGIVRRGPHGGRSTDRPAARVPTLR